MGMGWMDGGDEVEGRDKKRWVRWNSARDLPRILQTGLISLPLISLGSIN